MAKLKDGFYKQTAESIGSDLHVLLAGGGSKALSDFATSSGVVTALGTNGDYVTWTKNGTANNLTVPYATKATKLARADYLDSDEAIDNFLEGNQFKFAQFKTAANQLGMGSNDGMLLSIPWGSTDYGFQLAFDDTTGGVMKGRGKATSWGPWYTFLHSGNYTDYTVKKDGTGASGTWGINITGSSASTTNAKYLVPVSPETGAKFWYYMGQPTLANSYDGSSSDYSLYSYPKEGTYASSSNVNIQNLRLQWSTAYFHDIFASPNARYLWHRDVSNTTAHAWARIVEEDCTDYSRTWNIRTAQVSCVEVYTDRNRPLVGTNLNNELFYTTKATINWSTGTITAPKFDGTATRAQYLETQYKDNTNWYGNSYKAYLKWETNTVAKLIIDGYSTKVDYSVNSDKLDGIDSTGFLRQVVVPNNTTNDFNTFGNMTLTGRVDPTTGASLVNAPWSGGGPAGGYGVLTYLFNGSGYGTQMAWGYSSNRIYIRNRYWDSGVGATWRTSWDALALTSDIPTSLPANGGNADTVDGYHASSLWRSDGGTWNPSANILLNATANGQEWSFDITRNGKTGCYWHVWDSSLGAMLKVNADDGKVSAPFGFVGNLAGNATSADSAYYVSSWDVASNSDVKRRIWISHSDNANKVAYTDSFTYQTSTNTLFAPHLNGKITIGGGSYSWYQVQQFNSSNTNPSYYSADCAVININSYTGWQPWIRGVDSENGSWTIGQYTTNLHIGYIPKSNTSNALTYSWDFGKDGSTTLPSSVITYGNLTLKTSNTGDSPRLIFERNGLNGTSGVDWSLYDSGGYLYFQHCEGSGWVNTLTLDYSTNSASLVGSMTAGQFIATNSSGPHFTGTSTTGNWAYLRLSNSSCLWDIATRSNSGSGGLWLSRYSGGDNGIFVSASNTPKVGINNSSPSYALHVSGDSYATGWARAGSGFYVEGQGVHYMSNGTLGQIYLSANNEFNWSTSNGSLYFNYRAAANGTTVTNYIWNAGSSSSYATHTLGTLNTYGPVTITYNSYPGLTIHNNTTSGEASMYIKNNTAGWALGVNTWGKGAGVFGIGQYQGTGSSSCRLSIDNNGKVRIGTDSGSEQLNVGGWVGTTGTGGWYSITYTGGIYMEDSTWVRIYNGKKFYVSNSSSDAIHSAGGVYVAGAVHAYANYLKSTCNSCTVTIGSQNSSYCHYETTAPNHWFNKSVYVQGNIYGGSSYNRRLAYCDEIYAYALPYNGWWSSGSGQNVDNANGMTFVYSNHGSPNGWGILCTFDYQYNSSYKFQLFAEGYSAAGMYYRCRSSDRGGWTGWKTVIDSGNIGSQSVNYANSAGSVDWTNVTNRPTIPSVGNGTVTITQAGTTIGSFTMNQSGNTTIALTDKNTNYYPIRSYTTGLQISSYSGSANCQLYVPDAGASQSGVVSTGAQTFAGAKTFSGAMTVNSTITFGQSDSYGIRTLTNNYGRIGESSKRFYQCYVTSYYATSGFYQDSDIRLKNILQNVEVNLDDLAKLRKVYYTWKSGVDTNKHIGMIAQEVQKLYPELVNEDANTGYLSLAYDQLSVITLKAIDELYSMIKTLREEN